MEHFEDTAKISDKTIARMRWYLYALDELAREGMTTVASREIAEKVGVKSGLVRKDLCHFGGFGRPSVGYNITYLQKKIKEILRVNQVKNVAWVGAQRLADESGLLKKLSSNNCEVVAVFDPEPEKFGSQIGHLPVHGMPELERRISDLGCEMAVICPPGEDAQRTADKLIAGGVKAILNLTPVILVGPQGIAIRNVDLASELLTLSYYCGETERGNASP